MPSTIRDVANAAGVSVGTVSNVLNRPHLVAESTRHKVDKAIHSLGFVRSGAARDLRAGDSRVIGLVVLNLRNPFFTEMAQGVEDRLLDAGLSLLLSTSNADAKREERSLKQLIERQVAGLLVVPSQPSSFERILEVRDRGIPVVLVDSVSPDPTISAVSVDDERGARLAVGHLLEQGHRRIVFFNGPLSVKQCRDRESGARAAVVDFGYDPDEILRVVHLAGLESVDGMTAIEAILDEGGEPPTAVFAMNDVVAMGVMRGLRRRSLRIPEDMAVIGFDDISLASELMTPLSSVSQPKYDIGWSAADLLVGTSKRARQIEFSPELKIRDSSAFRR